MTYLRITERGHDADAFRATVSFEGGGEHEVEVVDPLAGRPEAEELLAWYYEEHLRYPFLDYDRVQAAKAMVTEYGLSLFAQLFPPGSDALYEFRKARDAGLDGRHIEVIGAQAFHRLHWETLQEPDAGAIPPIGVRVPIVRRAEAVRAGFDVDASPPTLNVLVVTARPGGQNDVGYRTISRPLLSALRRARVAVNVDLVRPGTWSAVRDHLEEATRRHGSGWYRIIHFDVHGAVGRRADFIASASDGYRFEQDVDPPDDGREALLFFETGTDGHAEPIPTEQVAALMTEHRVPVAVMNACQSAMATSEASLAQHLVESGVPVALGMAYSVTVTAAQLMMPVLYQQLAGGQEFLPAAHAARRRLFEVKGRRGYFDQDVALEDWVLPILYWQRPLAVQPSRPTPDQQAQIFGQHARMVDEPQPEYGFVGRDLDVQAIERHLLSDEASNQLLVRGMAGAGKSTLLAHLGWWWQATGLVDQVISFSYEDRAWTADHIIQEIAARLLDDQALALFQTRPADIQLEEVAMLLRADRHLVVIDNAESISAAPASIPHALSDEDRARLHRFLSRVRDGRSLVLIGSRGDEAWLSSGTFGSNTYILGRLDPQATSELVERILKRHGAPRPADDDERNAFNALLDLLGGYPLPLTVVLPELAGTVPSRLLEELRTGGESADPSHLVQRAIELSHGRLDPALQDSLMLLAPFTGTIPAHEALEDYVQTIAAKGVLDGLRAVDLPAALAQAASVGLARIGYVTPTMARVHPMLPYFLRTRLNERPALAAACSEAHFETYNKIAAACSFLLKSNDAGRVARGRRLTQAEYGNLYNAFEYANATGRVPMEIVVALEEYLDQAHHRHARRQLLDRAIAAAPTWEDPDRDRHLATLHNLAGIMALLEHRLEDARRHHEKELELLEASGSMLATAIAYHQLARVAEENRQYERAEELLGEALGRFKGADREDEAALSYQLLAAVQTEMQRFAEADQSFAQALAICKRTGDRLVEGRTYHSMGISAHTRGAHDDAERYYLQASEILQDFGDRIGLARTSYQLGQTLRALAETSELSQEVRQEKLGRAEQHLRNALRTDLEIGDSQGAAATLYELGRTAELEGRWQQAEANYEKALETLAELEDNYKALIVTSRLGSMLTRAGDAERAVPYSLRALSGRTNAGAPEAAMVDGHCLLAQKTALGDDAFRAVLRRHLTAEDQQRLWTWLEGLEASNAVSPADETS